MGEYAQKRLIRKLDLERFLSAVKPQPTPKAHLEQYTLSEHVAANILHMAAYSNSNILDKSVLDLGCGTGRLALGACFLGAKEVVGVDVDPLAIRTASENSRNLGLAACVQWVNANVNSVVGCFDTVLMNPPFGVQTREADRAFLAKALDVGNAVYSLHNHPEVNKRLIGQLKSRDGFLQVQPSPFLQRFIEKNNGSVMGVYSMLMTIPHMFDFHRKLKYDFVVDLYFIQKKP